MADEKSLNKDATEFYGFEVENLDTSLVKRIYDFGHGYNVDKRDFQGPQMLNDIRTIYRFVKKSIEEAEKEKDLIEMDKETYADKYTRKLYEDYLAKAEGRLSKIAEPKDTTAPIQALLNEKLVRAAGHMTGDAESMDVMTYDEFKRHNKVSKEDALKNMCFDKLKVQYQNATCRIRFEFLSHHNYDPASYYGEGKEDEREAVSKTYALKLVAESGEKHRIAGTERTLPELFGAMCELGDDEFRGKYGESKTRVMDLLGRRVHVKNVRKLDEKLDGLLREHVEGKNEDELLKIFLEGRAPNDNIVRLDKKKIAGLVDDIAYKELGTIGYLAFLDHYIEKTADNIHRTIDHVENVGDIGYYRVGAFMGGLSDEEFAKKYSVSKEKMLEDFYAGTLRQDYTRFAGEMWKVMFGANTLDYYVGSLRQNHEKFANNIRKTMFCEQPLDTQGELDKLNEEKGVVSGTDYKFMLIMNSKEKYDIDGKEEILPDIFKGLHGMDEKEFQGRFGKSKRDVIAYVAEKFYKTDMPKMYEYYTKGLDTYIGTRVSKKELYRRFSRGKTYRELVGGDKTLDELRTDLDNAVAMYKEAIEETSSLFMPEQWEKAREVIKKTGERFKPATQHEKDLAMRKKHIKKIRMLKNKKYGRFVDDYLDQRYCEDDEEQK